MGGRIGRGGHGTGSRERSSADRDRGGVDAVSAGASPRSARRGNRGALRDRLVPVGLERPGLEGTQQCGESAGPEPDRPRGIGSGEAGSETRGLLDMLESSHQRLARGPAEGHGSPVERDGDAVETHRHGGQGRRTVAGAQDTNGPIRERERERPSPNCRRSCGVAERAGGRIVDSSADGRDPLRGTGPV